MKGAINAKRLEEVEVLIWDFDWTLWGHNHLREFRRLISKLQIPYTEEYMKQFQKFSLNYTTYLQDRVITKDVMIKCIEENLTFIKQYNITGEQFLEVWISNDKIDFYTNSKKVVEECAKRGYIQYGLTDWFYAQQIIYLRKGGYMELFNDIFCCDGAYFKPNVANIERIIKNEEKSKFIMIGDSLTTDIKMANNAGIKSVWFNTRNLNKKDFPNIVPTYEISEIKQLLEIL